MQGLVCAVRRATLTCVCLGFAAIIGCSVPTSGPPVQAPAVSSEVFGVPLPAVAPVAIPRLTQHPFEAHAGGYVVANPPAGVTVDFTAEQVLARPLEGDWEVAWSVVSSGRAGAMTPLPDVAPVPGDCGGSPCAGRLEYRRDGALEWYENTLHGVQQGFELLARPAGDGPFIIRMAVTTALAPSLRDEGRSVVWSSAGALAFVLGDLKVLDSAGANVSARFRLRADGVDIVIEDADAQWPLSVDPFGSVCEDSWCSDGDSSTSDHCQGQDSDGNNDCQNLFIAAFEGQGCQWGAFCCPDMRYHATCAGKPTTADCPNDWCGDGDKTTADECSDFAAGSGTFHCDHTLDVTLVGAACESGEYCCDGLVAATCDGVPTPSAKKCSDSWCNDGDETTRGICSQVGNGKHTCSYELDVAMVGKSCSDGEFCCHGTVAATCSDNSPKQDCDDGWCNDGDPSTLDDCYDFSPQDHTHKCAYTFNPAADGAPCSYGLYCCDGVIDESCGPAPACVVSMNDAGEGCPDTAAICGASFAGGLGCQPDTIGTCQDSSPRVFKIDPSAALTVTFEDDVSELEFFLGHADGASALMVLKDAAGDPVGDPIASSACGSSAPSSLEITPAAGVRSLTVTATGGAAFLDSLRTNLTGDGVPEGTDPTIVEEIFGDFGSGWIIEGDTSGDTFTVIVTGVINDGPFAGITVTGTATKVEAAPMGGGGGSSDVTWCVTGATDVDAGPYQLLNTAISICKGQPWDLAGTIVLEGESAPYTGTYDDFPAQTFDLSVAAISLLGLPVTTLTLEHTYGGASVALTGFTTVGDGGAGLGASFVGTLTPGQDATLPLTLTVNWTPLAGHALTVSAATGTLNRVGSAVSADLSASFTDVALGTVTLPALTVQASYASNALTVLSATASGSFPPLGSITASGLLKSGSLCLEGAANKSFPSSGIPLEVEICLLDSGAAVSTLTAFVEGGPVQPVGAVSRLEGTPDASGTLCLTGDTSRTVPGNGETIGVEVCLNGSATAVTSTIFMAPIDAPLFGTLQAAGTWNQSQDLACLGAATPLDFPGDGGEVTFEMCLGNKLTTLASARFATTLDDGAGGTVQLKGVLNGNQLCMDGAAAGPGLFANTSLTATVCIDLKNLAKPVYGKVSLTGAVQVPGFGSVALTTDVSKPGETCFKGTVSGDTSWMPPGAVLHGIVASTCLVAGAFTPFQLEIFATFGTGDSAVTLRMAGEISNNNGAFSLSVGLAPLCGAAGCTFDIDCIGSTCAQTWTPFADLPGVPDEVKNLGFNKLSGTFARKADGTVQLEAVTGIAIADGAAIIPGVVELNKIVTGVRFSTGGSFEVTLGGEASFDLIELEVDVQLEGKVGTDVLQLTGKVVGDVPIIEPFEFFAGPGAFVLDFNGASVQLQADLKKATAQLTLSTSTTLTLLGNTADVAIQGQARLGGAAGTVFTVGGLIDQFVLNVAGNDIHLGKGQQIVIIASTSIVEDYKLDTNGNLFDGLELDIGLLDTGLTLIAKADLVPLQKLFPGASTELKIVISGLTKFRITGKLNLDWVLVPPSFKFPSINSVVVNGVNVSILVDAANVEISLGGAVSFTPIRSDGTIQDELTGTANLKIDSQGAPGGDILLDGLWLEPFFLPCFGLQNPGFTIKIDLKSSPAIYPKSLGYNGQIYFLKEGDWPDEIPLDSTGSPIVPDNVFTAGATLYYDTTPSQSGICFFGACVPLTPLLVRFDRQNIALSDIPLVLNKLLDGFRTFASVVPGMQDLLQALPSADKVLSAVDFSPVDVKLNQALFYLSTHTFIQFGLPFTAGVRARFDATLTGPDGDPKDVLLEGYLDPTGMKMEGSVDPFQMLPGFTVVGDPMRRHAGLNGGEVLVPHEFDMDKALTLEVWVLDDDGDGLAMRREASYGGFRLGLDAGAAFVRLNQGGEIREVRTPAGTVPPGEWVHLAVTMHPIDQTVKLYVDGAIVEGTFEVGLPYTLHGPSNADLHLGEGLDGIDDVRLWRVPRTAAQVGGESRIIGTNFYLDTDLIARWQFDWDEAGTAAYDSRFNQVGAKGMHGAYKGGAAPVIDLDDSNNIFFKLLMSVNNPLSSGLGFRVGIDFDLFLPWLDFTARGEANVALGVAGGSVYLREFTLLPLGPFGNFMLSGAGPNLIEHDFDDGFYAAANLAASPLPELAATSRFSFVHANGTEDIIGKGNFVFGCTLAQCTSPLEYRLAFDTLVDLAVPPPSVGPEVLGFTAESSFTTDDLQFHGTGEVRVFGLTLLSGQIEIGTAGAHLVSELTVPDLPFCKMGKIAGLEMDLDYQPLRLCSIGSFATPIPIFGPSFSGTVDTCIGHDPYIKFHGLANAGSLLGIPLGNLDVTVQTGQSIPTGIAIHDANLSIPLLFDGHLSGFLFGISNFDLNGSSNLNIPGGEISTTLKFNQTGIDVTGHLEFGPLIDTNISGHFTSLSNWSVTGNTDVSFFGLVDLAGQITLRGSGIDFNGNLKVFGKSATVSGDIDGPFDFKFEGSLGNASIAGFGIKNIDVTLEGKGGGNLKFSFDGTYSFTILKKTFDIDVGGSVEGGPSDFPQLCVKVSVVKFCVP